MSPQPIKIYGVPFSVHTRKAIVAMRMKDIRYEVVPVAPVNPATLPPSWRSISPTGLIPAIDDGGYMLTDSTAIVLYLERKVPNPSLLPSDPGDYGKALALDAWAGSELFRRVIHPLFFNQVVNPVLRKQPGDQAAIDGALRDAAPTAFAHLEATLEGEHLVNGSVSIADVAVVSNLLLFHYLGHRLDAGSFPKLTRYFRTHLDMPLLAGVLKEEKPVVESMGLDTSILS
jgi:glutathione S-transferase